MKSTAKCFIKIGASYIEITYAELLRRCKTNPVYQDKLFVPLHGTLMEVSERDYKKFYQDVRHQKYLEEEAIRAGEVSYHALDTDELSGEETLRDDSVNVERSATDRITCEILLDKLSEDERELVIALYFEQKSEREWSGETGLPQKTINNRRRSILKKLKKILEI